MQGGASTRSDDPITGALQGAGEAAQTAADAASNAVATVVPWQVWAIGAVVLAVVVYQKQG